MSMRQVFQETIRRDLAGLQQTHPNLKWLLETIILPILSLFPDFFLGIHYLGKTFGNIKRTMEKR